MPCARPQPGRQPGKCIEYGVNYKSKNQVQGTRESLGLRDKPAGVRTANAQSNRKKPGSRRLALNSEFIFPK